MDIRVVQNYDEIQNVDTRLIPLYEGFEGIGSSELDENMKRLLETALKASEFSAKSGDVKSLMIPVENGVRNIIVLGLGKKEELSLEKVRAAAAKALRECKKIDAIYIGMNVIGLDSGISCELLGRAMAEGIILADYKYEKFKSKKKESTVKEAAVVCQCGCIEEFKKGIEEGRVLGEATNFARELTNEPSNYLTPEELADRAKTEGEESGFEIEVFDEFKIREMGMDAFMAVAKGSEIPPRFIIMRYFGNPENKDDITALVGKGLTYDSGGYSLKPPAGMWEMKGDMGGSASVIGAISAIARMKLKKNVVAVVAACENMLSGGAYKNGDVIGSMAGKTIEVLNTDAEGRLTLADAVYYAVENEKATRVVDIATLTGAVGVALGSVTTGIITNDDEFYGRLEKACSTSGEKIWRLPGFEEYKELLKSDIADLKNTGGRSAGTITAGLFIGEFVKNKSWIHMDIAGTSSSDKNADYLSKGATGVGVRSMYQLVKEL